jgi:hypothetical protein
MKVTPRTRLRREQFGGVLVTDQSTTVLVTEDTLQIVESLKGRAAFTHAYLSGRLGITGPESADLCGKMLSKVIFVRA